MAPSSDAPPAAASSLRTIFVIRHGWHTGIVVRAADVPEAAWPARHDFAGGDYLEVGWGDREYYQAPDPSAWLALRALFWTTPGVLHVVGFSGPVERYFTAAEIVELRVSEQGLARLVDYVRTSYELDPTLILGTFEHALDWIVDHELDLSWFDARYPNARARSKQDHRGATPRELAARQQQTICYEGDRRYPYARRRDRRADIVLKCLHIAQGICQHSVGRTSLSSMVPFLLCARNQGHRRHNQSSAGNGDEGFFARSARVAAGGRLLRRTRRRTGR